MAPMNTAPAPSYQYVPAASQNRLSAPGFEESSVQQVPQSAENNVLFGELFGESSDDELGDHSPATFPEEDALSKTVLGDSMETDEMIDAQIEPEIVQETPAQPESMNTDAGTETRPNGIPEEAPALEARIPAKKDTTLREFLGKMDDYAPILPDAVTHYYLTLAGLPPPPKTSPRLARLMALATQKFVADIAADAYQYARIRASNTTSNNPMGGLGAAAGLGPGQQGASGAGGAPGGKDAGAKGLNLGVQRPGYGGGGQGGSQGRTVLTMEDLGMAVGEYGVNIKRGEFYR